MNPGGADHLAELEGRLEAHRAAIRARAEEAKARLDERVDDLATRAVPPRPAAPPPPAGDDIWDQPIAPLEGGALGDLDGAAGVATDDDGVPLWDDAT